MLQQQKQQGGLHGEPSRLLLAFCRPRVCPLTALLYYGRCNVDAAVQKEALHTVQTQVVLLEQRVCAPWRQI